MAAFPPISDDPNALLACKLKGSVYYCQRKAREQPSVCQRALAITFFLLMAVLGISNVIVGSVTMGRCSNAIVLPIMLFINGLLWLIPLLVLLVANCLRKERDLVSIYWCLEKLFLCVVAFVVFSTIYVLVSASQVKTLESLCTHSWLAPYSLAVVLIDWICFLVFFCLFCVHEVPPEPSPVEFRHLKNLPPLVFPWNRHRVIRTY